VTLPPGSRELATNGVIDLRNVAADRHLRLPSGCGGAIRSLQGAGGV
jgi:hypothetical protein